MFIFVIVNQLTDLQMYKQLLLAYLWSANMWFVFENIHNYLRRIKTAKGNIKWWHRGIGEPKLIYKYQKVLWYLGFLNYALTVYFLLK